MSSSPCHARGAPKHRRQPRGCLGRCAGLGPGRLHPEDARLAVALEVDPADDPVVEEHRQRVVPELAVGLGRVDLDAVVEVEQALGSRAKPDDRVERGQHGGCVDAPRSARVAVEPGRGRPPAGRPPRDLDRHEHTFVDEVGDGLLDACALQPPVVGEVGLGRDALRGCRERDERAHRVGLGRRLAQQLSGQTLLGERVAPARTDGARRTPPRPCGTSTRVCA